VAVAVAVLLVWQLVQVAQAVAVAQHLAFQELQILAVAVEVVELVPPVLVALALLFLDTLRALQST
jgi:hypothetical protein